MDALIWYVCIVGPSLHAAPSVFNSLRRRINQIIGIKRWWRACNLCTARGTAYFYTKTTLRDSWVFPTPIWRIAFGGERAEAILPASRYFQLSFLSASVPNVDFFGSESDLGWKTPVPVVTTAGSLPAAVVIYSSLFSDSCQMSRRLVLQMSCEIPGPAAWSSHFTIYDLGETLCQVSSTKSRISFLFRFD